MSDAYLESVEKADAITKQLCEVYAEYGWFGCVTPHIIHAHMPTCNASITQHNSTLTAHH